MSVYSLYLMHGHSFSGSARNLAVSSEFNVTFQHKHGYIRDERSGVESYPYPVKEVQRYINLNPGCLFVQQPPKKGKGSRGSFKLLR